MIKPSHSKFQASAVIAFSAIALLTTSLPSHAASIVFNISANGFKEVNAAGTPNQGDPDGTAIGTLKLDNGTGAGTTGSATITLTLANIDLTTLSGNHLHQAPSTTIGSIVLDFGDPDNYRIGSVLSGTVTGLSATVITSVLANPTAFYYNLHNDAFPSGAVRDQLPVPEPGCFGLIALGAMALAARRRRA